MRAVKETVLRLKYDLVHQLIPRLLSSLAENQSHSVLIMYPEKKTQFVCSGLSSLHSAKTSGLFGGCHDIFNLLLVQGRSQT